MLIEFSDSGIYFAILHKSGKKFFVQKEEFISCDYQEITNGVPINLSAIFVQIRKYIEKQKVVNPNAIIVCKGLADKPEFLQKSISFQLALCCTKAGINVHKILSEGLL